MNIYVDYLSHLKNTNTDDRQTLIRNRSENILGSKSDNVLSSHNSLSPDQESSVLRHNNSANKEYKIKIGNQVIQSKSNNNVNVIPDKN